MKNTENKKTKSLTVAAIVGLFILFSFSFAKGASLPLVEVPNLESIIVWEHTGKPTPYVFNLNDNRLINKIDNLGPRSVVDFSTSAAEYYDVYISDENGNLNPKGSFLTISCYRNNNLTNEKVGNNISGVELKSKGGESLYATHLTRVVLGTGLSGEFLNSRGFAEKSLGAPAVGKCTYLGDQFSSITLGFSFYYSPCTSHFTKKCVGNAIYWFDSCGKQEDLVQTCGANQICQNAQCLTIACSTKSDCGTDGYINQPYCRGNSVYQDYVTYTCHNPGTTSSYCSSSTTARLIQTCSTNQQCMNGRCETTTTCYPYYYKRCVGNHLYWFDSCNNQQELIQYCPAGCEFDRCKSYWSIFTPTCVSHAYKLCVGNAIYWFDSCHNRQELVQQCPADQTCQYGQCVNIQPPVSSYNPYFRIGCYLNSLYWYDSFGVRSGIYKSCVDNNPCTEDTCLEGKCLNILKCDGSTCARGSPEYQNYCFGNSCGNKVCDHNLGENPLNCPNDCSLSQASIQFTFLAKTDVAPEWSRKIDVASGNRIYFKIGIKNQNNFPLDGSKLMVNFPVEILQPENIKINDISLSGDLSRGVEIQRIEANQETIITFEADTQKITEEVTKEIASSLNYAGSVFQDLIQIHFVPPKVAGFATAAIEPSIDEKKFWEKWSWWIIGLIVFILLFFIVFRRLSKTS